METMRQRFQESVTLEEREGWAMLLLANQMEIIAKALGDDSGFARQLRELVPELKARAQGRLDPG